ncbi:DgyrCDS14461 [Dimorphilus gyrociliatus]|uniref:DgyrCDS14461 n=1 Tax=Dimorphilus gyrociliatus TaxID=2664684 RepID=A0A7I8WDN7_9ANNE|nr:DgyrCDS14461 [Dimorphilus gyrociliatus]
MKAFTIHNFALLFLSFGLITVHSDSFSLKVESPAQILEDSSSYNLYFQQITGTPTCSYTLTKPDGTILLQSSKSVNSALVYENFQGSLFSGTTENYVLTYTYSCTSGGTTLEFEVRGYVYSREQYGSGNLPMGYGIEIEMSTEQTSPIRVRIQGGSGGGSCSITRPDTSIATVDNVGPLSIGQDSLDITVTKTGSQESFFIAASCISNGKTFQNEIPVYFSPNAPSPWASATGDPHFAQNVVDKSTIRIKIFGQLKDDYYMHKIVIQSPSANITVSLKDIHLGQKDTIQWNENSKQMTLQTNQLKCEIVNGKKIIFTELKSLNAIAVEKSKHFLGEMHLDVGFRLMPEDYNEMSGLIGDIGQKKFKFFTAVQIGEDSLNNEMVSIQVDNKFLRGSVVQRNKKSCWLLDVNDILKPLKTTDYLFKRID